MGFLTGGTPASTGRFEMPGTNMGTSLHQVPIIGSMFPNPADEFKQAQMHKAAQAYSMMRPEMVQTAMNAMNQQSQALQPTNNALAAMYGAGATQGFQAQNPFGPTAFSRGAAGGTDPQFPSAPQAPPQGPGATALGPEPQDKSTFAQRERWADLNEDWRLGNYNSQTDPQGGTYGAGGTFDPSKAGPPAKPDRKL